ncbi:MAG: hypothetical protein JXR07_13600 [Reichenbachiella sp.]
MEVRGSVIKGIDEFVKSTHSEGYDTWKSKLSNETLSIMEKAVPSKWYPLNEGIVEPTTQMCNLFYSDKKKGAWESGRFSAETALSGIYKVFVLISTPAFMLKRASRVLTTFYNPTKIEVKNSTDKSMLLHLTELPTKNELIEYRIGGWMEKALEICGCKNLKINVPHSIAKGDPLTAYDITWE